MTPPVLVEASVPSTRHRDFPEVDQGRREFVAPLPWADLSRSECVILAIALDRSTRGKASATIRQNEA